VVVGTQCVFIILCCGHPLLFPGGGRGLLSLFIVVGARHVFVIPLFCVGVVWHHDVAVPSPLKGGVTWGMLAINCQLVVNGGGGVVS